MIVRCAERISTSCVNTEFGLKFAQKDFTETDKGYRNCGNNRLNNICCSDIVNFPLKIKRFIALNVLYADARFLHEARKFFKYNYEDAALRAIENLETDDALFGRGKNTIAAMQKLQIKRLISIGSSGYIGDQQQPFYVRFLQKHLLQRIFRHICADNRRIKKIVSATAFDWTIVRPL